MKNRHTITIVSVLLATYILGTEAYKPFRKPSKTFRIDHEKLKNQRDPNNFSKLNEKPEKFICGGRVHTCDHQPCTFESNLEHGFYCDELNPQGYCYCITQNTENYCVYTTCKPGNSWNSNTANCNGQRFRRNVWKREMVSNCQVPSETCSRDKKRVVFLLEGSSDLDKVEFGKSLEFISDVARSIADSEFAVVQFSSFTTLEVSFTGLVGLLESVHEIQQHGWFSNVEKGLEYTIQDVIRSEKTDTQWVNIQTMSPYLAVSNKCFTYCSCHPNVGDSFNEKQPEKPKIFIKICIKPHQTVHRWSWRNFFKTKFYKSWSKYQPKNSTYCELRRSVQSGIETGNICLRHN